MRLKVYKSPAGAGRVVLEMEESEKRHGEGHINTVPSLNAVGDYWLEYHVHNPARAEMYYRKGLFIREIKLGCSHPDVADSLFRVGRALIFQQLFIDALPIIQKGFDICARSFDRDHWRFGRAAAQMSQILSLIGHRTEAGEYYRKAEHIWLAYYMTRSSPLPDYHPDYDQLYVFFEMKEKWEMVDQIQQNLLLDKPPAKGRRKECFIATAVYGSEGAAEVECFRLFRDRFLENSWIGIFLINAYYRVSPPIARHLKRSSMACAFVRRLLNMLIPIVKRIKRG